MEFTCKQCGVQFRAAVQLPLGQAVRLICPSCGRQTVLKPASAEALREQAGPGLRKAVIADEPRDFRAFLGSELRTLGFDVTFFDSSAGLFDFILEGRPDLLVVNVYLRGKLGVEISEAIKADPSMKTRVVLIGALFRANRFRANPTNLYGADEYIEEQIPARELRQIIRKLFPAVTSYAAEEQPREYDEARRLARLILSDIVIYNPERVESGIRDGNFFDLLSAEIDEGREYYESRVPLQIRQKTEFFNETLHQFVDMKREELGKAKQEMGES
jgi:CheY-like chemotaxis protein